MAGEADKERRYKLLVDFVCGSGKLLRGGVEEKTGTFLDDFPFFLRAMAEEYEGNPAGLAQERKKWTSDLERARFSLVAWHVGTVLDSEDAALRCFLFNDLRRSMALLSTTELKSVLKITFEECGKADAERDDELGICLELEMDRRAGKIPSWECDLRGEGADSTISFSYPDQGKPS